MPTIASATTAAWAARNTNQNTVEGSLRAHATPPHAAASPFEASTAIPRTM